MPVFLQVARRVRKTHSPIVAVAACNAKNMPFLSVTRDEVDGPDRCSAVEDTMLFDRVLAGIIYYILNSIMQVLYIIFRSRTCRCAMLWGRNHSKAPRHMENLVSNVCTAGNNMQYNNMQYNDMQYNNMQ
eukprot:SAG31_NODE_593_length_13721_cov_5.192175_6_plen_130_part_00